MSLGEEHVFARGIIIQDVYKICFPKFSLFLENWPGEKKRKKKKKKN